MYASACRFYATVSDAICDNCVHLWQNYSSVCGTVAGMIDHSGRVTKPVVAARVSTAAAVGCHGNRCDVTSHLPARSCDAAQHDSAGLGCRGVQMSSVDAGGAADCRQVAPPVSVAPRAVGQQEDCDELAADAEVCELLRHAASGETTTLVITIVVTNVCKRFFILATFSLF